MQIPKISPKCILIKPYKVSQKSILYPIYKKTDRPLTKIKDPLRNFPITEKILISAEIKNTDGTVSSGVLSFTKPTIEKIMKHLNSNPSFDNTDLDLFDAYTQTTTSPSGWRVKYKDKFLTLRGKSIWKAKKTAKSAFTRHFGANFSRHLFDKYKHTIPASVFSRELLKRFTDHVQSIGLVQFVEIP